MAYRVALVIGAMALATMQLAYSQAGSIGLPASIAAGSAFSVQTAGTGNAVLYVVGPAQALKRDVQLGEAASFPAGSLTNAGRYLAILVAGPSTLGKGWFDVVPARQPADLSFLARPSRLPIGVHDGISGTVYVFDVYRNLITRSLPVTFKLSDPTGTVQQRTVTTQDGKAIAEMDSTSKQGFAQFQAEVDGVSTKRVVEQVPGNPCGLKMTAKPSGNNVELQTSPVRDCSGNAVPDGTIVTFTENYNGVQSTADVPLKHDIAEVEMPVHAGATITVASGVVLGNEIHWEK